MISIKKVIPILATISLLAIIIIGCGTKDQFVGEIVEAYYQALVEGKSERMMMLSCQEFQTDALLEFDSFQGVKPTLLDLDCKKTEEDEKQVSVNCTGKISATYGNEIQQFDLSMQTFKLEKEGQEWLICGRE